MCGLIGVFAPDARTLTRADLGCFHDVARRSQRRGRDASGLVTVGPAEIAVAKAATGIATLLRDRPVAEALRGAAQHATAVFGHTRLATHGSILETKNNHPIRSERWVVVHNGWITNREEVVERFRGHRAEDPETDSFAINVVLEAWLDSPGAALQDFLGMLAGELTVIAWSVSGLGVAYTNVGNLYVASDAAAGGVLVAASEPAFLPAHLRRDARQLELREPLVLADAQGTTMRVRELRTGTPPPRTGASRPAAAAAVEDRLAQLGDLHAAISSWAAGFDRCTRCVLPTRFPHSDADASGVCVYCREYESPHYGGTGSLVAAIDGRLPPGSRQVLVGLSGGRDSCYSLHLVHELGYEPIAFTYDWGLVTNEARENMARMCGRLGVEHVLVARDIQQVKRRLRGGLAALLRTPDLGVIPLLMSGDKSWMHRAQQVARERGGTPVVMGTHRAETTGFKSALATGKRVRPSGAVEHFWKLEPGPLLRMGARYVGFGAREPKALPILVQDALPGAWHYYVRRQEMVLPFDHVRWDGDVIERTITERYGWSFSNVSKWRAGDGTAVVYNLLYLAGLGFSELETFLSNQIRSGDITRERALQQLLDRPALDGDELVGYLRFIEADVLASLDGLVRVVSASEGAVHAAAGGPAR